MDWLLSLLPGGSLTAILGAVLAGIAALSALIFGARKAGRDAQRAKEADAYAKHLEEIAGAHNARNRVDPDRVPDRDPYRRD